MPSIEEDEVVSYLRKIRIAMGISIRVLASRMHLPHTTLHAYEMGRRRLTIDMLNAWSTALGKDPLFVAAVTSPEVHLEPHQKLLLRDVLRKLHLVDSMKASAISEQLRRVRPPASTEET